jgi:hypothetical protein
MTNPRLIKVTSLSQYVAEVSKIHAAEQDSAWFRGHSSAAYQLIPSVLRDCVPLTSAYGSSLRGDEHLAASGYAVTFINPERMLDDFKRKAAPFMQYSPKNDFEWLFLMQHHGVPTRLLDWTTNALVALYFAVSSIRPYPVIPKAEDWDDEVKEPSEFDANSAAVFAINPRKFNRTVHADIKNVVDVAQNFDYWKAYSRPMEITTAKFDIQHPLCITAPQISPRMRAQSGLFTIHGRDINALDYFSEVRALLTKILIPFENALTIQRELHQFGISEASIYPSLESVAKDVHVDEIRRYDWERKNYLEKLNANPIKTKKKIRVTKGTL